ncbi:MAG: tRNA uridine-5-carboxymethylaminomethyl(34) synthesis GTPase MnmE [Lachnospiraceae bacterium]|nr:tRNA uridine-5-carboxymethylaminomethyl(34) synthesis GTPase MnmE [Lachnospiraceae bacterium]
MKSVGFFDTIAAISTPPGTGGIGIIRISGDKAISIVDGMFKSNFGKKIKDMKSHSMAYGKITDKTGSVLDEVLISVMRAPNTYTKEDVVEINCHGGAVVLKGILDAVLNSGARMAEAGEFTKRAFLNGRIDLSQAEGIIDVINSKTELSRDFALNALSGKLSESVNYIKDRLLKAAAAIEVAIDYPEYEIEKEDKTGLMSLFNEAEAKLSVMIQNSDMGRIIKEGLSAAIIGRPNAGKSSFLNRLLNEERAIVTDIPGTTRDMLEEFINLSGIPVKFIDTAGIRDARDGDIIEKIGIERSLKAAADADVIIFMIDGQKGISDEDVKILELTRGKKIIALINKCDIKRDIDKKILYEYVPEENIAEVSVLKDMGVEKALERLKEMFLGGDISFADAAMVSNARQKAALSRALENVKKAKENLMTDVPEDIISMDIMEAVSAISEITGENADDALIDKIFSEFCIGK